MKYCPKCGFGMDSEAPFCGNCGFDFRSVKLPEEPQPVIQPLQQIPRQPEVSEQPAPARPSAPEQPKKKSKALIIVLVIVGVLLIGVGTLFVLESKDIINFFDGIGSDKDTENASGEAVTDEDGNVIYSGETEKMFVINRIDYDDGSYDKFFYDSYGNLYSLIKYADGEAYLTVENTYDKKGNKIKSEQKVSYEDFEMNDCYEYTYDENGNMLTHTSTSGDSQNWHYDFTYDNKGNVLTKTFYRKDVLAEYYEYTYDTDGKQLTETKYDEDRSKVYCDEYKYDDNGMLILKVRSDDEGRTDQRYEYTYDDNGNMLTDLRRGLYANNCYEYTYDDYGNKLTETRYDDKEELQRQAKYTWEEIDVAVENAQNIREEMLTY